MRWLGYLLATLLVVLVGVVAVVAFAPSRWIIGPVERFAAGSLGLELDIGGLERDLLSRTPGVSVTDVSLGDGQGGTIVSGANLSASVAGGRLLHGELVFERVALSDANVDLAIDENGRGNWESLLPETGAQASEDEGSGGGIPAIRDLEVENVSVDVEDRRLGRSVSLNLSASGSTTDPERPTIIDASGTLDGLPLEIDAELASLDRLAGSLDELAVDADARLGDTRLTVNGTVGDPRTLSALDLELALSAPDTEDLETLAGLSLPVLPPFSVKGALGRDGEQFVLSRFEGTLGDSDIGGEVRVDPSTEPLTLYADITSRTLDLDDLAGVLGGTPDPTETATDEQVAKAEADTRDGRLLPDTPLELRPLVRAFDGAIRYRAEKIRSPTYPIDSLDVRLEIEGDSLTLSPFTLGVAGGTLDGSISLDVLPVPAEGTVELSIRSIDLKRIVAALGIDDDSVGTLGGRLKYWIKGDSVASFLAHADGGLFLLMTEGQLDALLAELSSVDVVESLMLLFDPGKQLTPIDCAYLDLQSADGMTDIKTFVIDTADTVFVADGVIDLGEESFDVAIEPHPKDASLLEVQSGVRVSGTPGDFRVVPDAELGARVAAAAVLSAVAAPAAALLAFVGLGDGEDSPYCKGLVDSVDQAR